uniref:Uncharacterized protein n=1 Tax=Anopheles farauti TaxID=69004 RepID=A0A182QTF0_9DIPT
MRAIVLLLLVALVLLCSEGRPTSAVRVVFQQLPGTERMGHLLRSPNSPKCPKNYHADRWGYCRPVVLFEDVN